MNATAYGQLEDLLAQAEAQLIDAEQSSATDVEIRKELNRLLVKVTAERIRAEMRESSGTTVIDRADAKR